MDGNTPQLMVNAELDNFHVVRNSNTIVNHLNDQELTPKTRDFGIKSFSRLLPGARNLKDVCLTIVGVAFMIFSLWVAALGNAYSDLKNQNIKKHVDDPGFQHIPDLIIDNCRSWYTSTFGSVNLGDIFLVGTCFSILTLFFLSGDRFATIVRRFAYVTGSIYLLRTLCVTVTVLPTPYDKCIVQTSPDSMRYQALQILTLNRITCGDVFFSGHSTLGMWLIITYQSSRILNAIAIIYNCLGMFFVIATGFHYSIDVVAGFVFTSLFWNCFHWAWTVQDFESTFIGSLFRLLDDCHPHCQTDHLVYYNNTKQN